ncbi:MAG: PD-(D/E)XK nuclease family protein [Caulobacteraceae bacterium]
MKDDLKKVSKVHTQYKLPDGTRLPGVTTILGVLNKPALVSWANKLGLEGIDSSKYVDESARIGTLAHYLVQCDLTGEKPDLSTYGAFEIDKAENSLLSYYEWKKNKQIETIENELPLVSEKYRYGGTIDCLCTMNGETWLLDFKTGKAIYPEMLTQLSAYMQLLNENGYEVKKARILRIGRDETEGFEERVITQFEQHWELFQHCLAIYRLQKQLGG